MKYKKTIIPLALVVFLLSIAGVSASEIGDIIASENANTIDLSTDNDIEDNLQTSEENMVFTSTDYDEAIAQTDTEVLGADSATYSDLANEISQPGNITLTHKNYTYDEDATAIIITEANKVIDGNGAVIDMNGSTIRAFHVSASGVTIKNLTIKNANYDSGGGAIHFSSSGTVTNCNFADNTATYYGGAVYFNSKGEVTNCNFVDNKATGDYGRGGAVFFNTNGEVTNCNFTNNTASKDGGAVFFNTNGEVTNCNFTNNTASKDGGAVWIYSGTVSNCNFTDNTASGEGGAIRFSGEGTVTNCNFTGNNATAGSAIYFYITSATKTVSNSRFLNNRANAEALEITKNDNNITITFTGNDNLLNAIYSRNGAEVTFTNVTYWGANGITTVSATMSGSNKATGQNITVGVVVNGKVVLNEVNVTDENGTIVLDIIAGENYYISARHNTDSYYTEAEKTITNMIFNVNVTSQTTNNKTVNITAKSNIPNDVVQGKLLFILPNGTQINANYAGNGTWWAVHIFDYGVYQVSASYYGLYDVTVKNATIAIKLKTELTSNAITTTYNINKNLVITLKDSTGKALSGVSVTVDLNGAKTYATDKNGQVKASTKGLTPKAYTAKVTFNGNTKYAKSTKDIKVTVKKATPKMKAKKKTFKRTVKTKKYTIVLKDNTGKAMKKVKVTLKIKGKKTITVKTNSKGKATFKIKKLTKKGTFKSKITFKGNKYYNKVTKKVKIKVK
ncbi:right-handed parallel beta-helix repeat-containing protein [Methanobrevibacter sp.]|uniref:right-handed parallel beta-helix repeat-containing protein n=1 Tax=Methanobrevibacter sp. TaxID=66852 RepID=UPI00388F3FFB